MATRRLCEADWTFIVDDNGEGYVDDGREEWDDGQGKYRYAATDSEGEDEQPAKGKAGMTEYQSIHSVHD
jgi:hypothetical protein